jgi:serine/threonine protein kinase
MPANSAVADVLPQRLPLPLAQICRRAHNAKSALERHQAAFYLWEATLKLLGAVCVVEYARLDRHEEALGACLHNLARPALGHWWEFTRRLLPVLAEQEIDGFGPLRDLILGKRRDDWPRAAGLDTALRQALDGSAAARAAVYPAELFDRLVQYRNREIGHGAAGQRPEDFYERMGRSLLLGAIDVLQRLDVLASRKLVHVAEVRQVRGSWRVERFELIGETARRLEPLEVPRDDTVRLPDGERVYLSTDGRLNALHPLLIYDAEANECAFLNACRGKARADYLYYTSGRTESRPEVGNEQRALLARALGVNAVDEEQAERWAADSQAEEPTALGAGLPTPPHRTIGEFELLSELGRGGMGVVYRAWQPSLGRQVALKSLNKPGDAKAEARFRREIRALGQVEHPHLVKIFTSGADGDQWFYVMELVEGAPLSAVCAGLQTRSTIVTEVDLTAWQEAVRGACSEARHGEKPLSDPPDSRSRLPGGTCEERSRPAGGTYSGEGYVRRVVTLLTQVAEASEALHRHGIVHRDIKPGNILLNAAGDHATLMDLGLAQVADDVEGKLTRTRQFVGTLRYASPEQVLAVAPVDGRSDVYSLGATLWELLALRPLFGATDQTPIPELMQTIQHEEPERLRACHPGLGRDLEAIVHKCLEKVPGRRYQTARELADDLRRYLDGEPVQARAVGWLDRNLKWVRRHPREAAAYGLSVLVAVLVLVGGGFGWLWQRAEDARRRADDARQDAERAKGIAEDALGALATQQGISEAALKGKLEAEQQARAAQKREAEVAQDLIARFNDLQAMRRAQRFGEAGDLRAVRSEMLAVPPERRHWEWYYLMAELVDGRMILQGHMRGVTSVAFSPDGRRLASGYGDGTVVVWEISNQHLWHLREAAGAEKHEDWAAAAWHLQGCRGQEIGWQAAEVAGGSSPLAIGAVSAMSALRAHEGRILLTDLLTRDHRACLELGRWQEADADFQQLRALGGDTPALWHRRAWRRLYQAHDRQLFLAAVANAAPVPPLGLAVRWGIGPVSWAGLYTVEFRRVCDEMAARFPDPNEPATADSIAYTRLLIADGLANDPVSQARLENLARFAVDQDPRSADYRETYGAALYRAGKFREAVAQLNIAIEKAEKSASVWQKLFLAMAHCRLGNQPESRDWLMRAVRQIEAAEKAGNPGWEKRLQWHLLRAEAEATLGWRVPAETAK